MKIYCSFIVFLYWSILFCLISCKKNFLRNSSNLNETNSNIRTNTFYTSKNTNNEGEIKNEFEKLGTTEQEFGEEMVINAGKDHRHFKTYSTVSLTSQNTLKFETKELLQNEIVEPNDNKNVIVESYYHKTLPEKGWNKLSISTYNKVSAETQGFLAGYIEGRQTFEDINNFHYNLKTNTLNGSFGSLYEDLRAFFKDVYEHLKMRVETDYPYDNLSDTHWKHIKVGYKQLLGMLTGYNQQAEFSEKSLLSIEDLLIVQADGEVSELLRYLNYIDLGKKNRRVELGRKQYFSSAFRINTEDPSYFWKHLLYTSKCSAFIKLLKDSNGRIQDLISGHATWSGYSELLRTYKHYKFELDTKLGSSEVTFSSYPGCLSSTDDYYLTNHRLMITETTIDVVDVSLFKAVKSKDKYIPNFLRVMAATRFAKSGESWVNLMRDSNSGTYSSQWMIVDYKLFEKAKKENIEQEKIFIVLEQVPGSFVDHDVTSHLFKHGYFGSFNRAFFSETKNSLHDSLIKQLYGNFAYYNSKRKIQFQKLESLVRDMEGFKDVLRYNGYKNPSKNFTDPSVTSPGNAIAARADLEGDDSNLSGALDAKITNFEMIQSLKSLVISGPTTRKNKLLPIFDWKKLQKTRSERISHRGVPDRFNYSWLSLSPKTIKHDSDMDKEKTDK